VAIFLSTKIPDNYEKVQFNDFIMYVQEDLRSHSLEEALAMGEKSLAEKYDLISIEASEFARVFRFTVEFSGSSRTVFYKEYLCRSLLDFIKHIFRPSRACRAFRAGLMMQRNGVNVPEVVAFGEERNPFVCRRNFLLTMEVPDTEQLSACLSGYSQDLPTEDLKNKRQLIQAFGQTIGRMHAMGIFHGDLRLGNVLVRRNDSGWNFFFLDNERTQRFVQLPDRLRLKNLVQVNMFRKGVSNSDRLRFLKAYLGENPAIITLRKYWARKIIDKTNKRLLNKND
jgi:serine/threonine protein kinase